MTTEQTTIQVVYPITEADITARFAGYAELTADSPQGYKAVQAAIGELRSARVDVEKRRKDLKAESLEYGRRVDEVAKYLTGLIEAIEHPLKAKKAAVDEEKARVKAEKEAAERAAVEAQIRAEQEAEAARLKAEAERLAQERAALEWERAALCVSIASPVIQPEPAQKTVSALDFDPERVRRVLAWIAEQASKTNMYDATDDLSDYYCGNEDDACGIGEKNGQIETAQSLQNFLTGASEDLPEIEDFAEDEDSDEDDDEEDEEDEDEEDEEDEEE